MSEKLPMTQKGVDRLREELARLKEERPKISREIGAAREHGDLSENAEYHAAREQQGFIEGRIAALESALADAQIIDVKSLNAGGKVVFGATVDLINLNDDSKASYQIVGEEEADVSRGLVSIGSPIARALIGKEEGESIEVRTPRGAKSYEILAVRYV